MLDKKAQTTFVLTCNLLVFAPQPPPLTLYVSVHLSDVRRMEAAFQKVLQVDLEVNGLLDPLSIRTVTWQVEYPLTHTLSDEIQTLIRLAPQDLGGIVPLAMVRETSHPAISLPRLQQDLSFYQGIL